MHEEWQFGKLLIVISLNRLHFTHMFTHILSGWGKAKLLKNESEMVPFITLMRQLAACGIQFPSFIGTHQEASGGWQAQCAVGGGVPHMPHHFPNLDHGLLSCCGFV